MGILRTGSSRGKALFYVTLALNPRVQEPNTTIAVIACETAWVVKLMFWLDMVSLNRWRQRAAMVCKWDALLHVIISSLGDFR